MKINQLILFIVLLMSSGVYAACTIDQRIDLSKAGYDKDEIEQLCAAADGTADGGSAAVQGSGTPALPSGVDLLNQGAIVGSDSVAYNKRRCVVSEAGVTFPKKGLVGFENLTADNSTHKIDRGDREIFLSISLSSGFNSEWCLLMRVDSWRYKNDEAGFNADADKYQAQFEAITAELKRRNMRFE